MSKTISFLSIGSLGTGFGEESLRRGLELQPDFIGADAGSVDGGPDALAGGEPIWSRESYARDLRLLVTAASEAKIPLLVGSCGMSGRDWGVDYFAELVREIGRERSLELTMARIYSELDPATVQRFHENGQLSSLSPELELSSEDILSSHRIVGVMGVEPFQLALTKGADVILAGRATDTAIFAALPLLRGFDPGLSWHAAKIAECGSSCAEPRRRLDVLYVSLSEDGFVVAPLADDLRCTPFSVAAHQLHEVADPLELIEPGWTTDLRQVRYEPVDERTTRVTGAQAHRTPYTVKLEGVRESGYQRAFMMSVRDPTILDALDSWIDGIQDDIQIRSTEIAGEGAYSSCDVHVRIYGKNGTLGDYEPKDYFEGHEAFILVDVVAPTKSLCESISSVVWYAFMHAKSPGWKGGTTVAYPFSRHVIDFGKVYKFHLNHVISDIEPNDLFRHEMEEIR